MEAKKRVLIVDDEPSIVRMLELALAAEGYDTVIAGNGTEAIAAVEENEPDVVVLDIIMPGIDGFEACRRIRNISSAPIIMLTARRNEMDIIQGLDAGADEYVTKPFSVAELSARIRAALRRAEISDDDPNRERRLVFDNGDLVIDLDRRAVIRNGAQVPLSATEFRLISFLVANAGRVVPHERILEYVWGPEHTLQTSHLRAYIALLRKKIEQDPQNPRLILSAHSVGYHFEDPALFSNRLSDGLA